MLEKVITFLSEYNGIDKDQIKEDSQLIFDLGLTSYDVVEMCCHLEEEFGIKVPETDITSIKTVGDIVQYLESHGGNSNT